MPPRRFLTYRTKGPSYRVLIVLGALLLGLFSRCSSVRQPAPKGVPLRMVWAWERPEDLRFLDPEKAGVAFLAQTITLSEKDVLVRPRRQPLRLPDGMYVMAVTRIETVKRSGLRPAMNEAQIRRTSDLIARTLRLPNVRALQIDFDAVVSERSFYKNLLETVRRETAKDIPLSITSLASWCIGDRWIRGLPVDEVVPMAFEMGTDEIPIRKYLTEGRDWRARECTNSYGVYEGDMLLKSLDRSRRIYFFKKTSWQASDVDKLSL